ncbi:hypothetical protein B7P43_G16194 [Cryptotermes secundus]|uniref:Tetratricopeptide repeat protein 31 n=1 Tax=Cryptotermes secundus TaxID=105785 RepID=A0A2J7PV64_9NEOP|nr:RNA polymerase-associated protein RTF1 homolog isoform X2 [Cryptotermes secundus]PNF20235.1 hypothetical protein B7P43_G16194 [Cryptotermes secundus]PNF20238.1 hypothetical protein B7P43_G16194 [Cryptotermes secundus]
MAKDFTQHSGIPDVIEKFKVIFGQNDGSACTDAFSDVSDIDDYDDDDFGSTSESTSEFDDRDLMLHLFQQAQAHEDRIKFLRGLRKKREIAEKNAEELVAEEEREKRKVEKRKAKKKRRREKKKEEKEINCANSKSKNNSNGNISKKENVSQSSKKMTNKNSKSKLNGDSFSAQPTDEREEEEEDFLDPNSAFVSVAVSKNKRSCNTTAISHMDRSQRTSNARKPPDAEDLAVTESERLAVEGYNAASREEYTEAVDYFTKAIRFVHNDHRFYGNRSFCYCQLGQYTKALKDADKAIMFAPQNPKGYYRRGEALRGLKQYKQAEEAFERVVQLDEDCDDAKQELETVKIQQLVEMGFVEDQAFAAVQQYGTVQAAVEVLTAESPAASFNSSGCEIYYSDEEEENFVSSSAAASQTPQVIGKTAKKMDPTNPEGHLSLWVGNITQSVSEKQLIEMFSRFGVVLSVRLLPEKFCAFINFRDKSAPGPAMKHLQGKNMGGERLLIRYPNNPVPEQIVLKRTVPTGMNQAKLTGPVNGDECHFWRTTGCAFGNKCRYKHMKENKGIDRKPWQKTV